MSRRVFGHELRGRALAPLGGTMQMVAEFGAAFRFWIRRPIAALAATLSLAVGLAVATSVFAFADAALWRPLPLPDPDRVVWIDSLDRGEPSGTSPGVFTTWRSATGGVTAIGAIRPSTAVLRTAGPSIRVDGAFVSADVMRVLGVNPAVGRAIGDEDDRAGAPAVVLLSDRLWRTQFGSARDVVGREVTLGGIQRTVIGVLPSAVDVVGLGFDWWAPLGLSAAQASNVGPRYLSVVARLAGADSRRLASELESLADAAGARGDTGERLGVRIEPLQAPAARQARPVLLPLLGAVLAVLLLAALNATSLLLAQGQARRTELAVRASLGASRGRLVRQLVFESVCLTLVAGGVSLLMSLWIMEAIRIVAPVTAGGPKNVTLDLRVALFAMVLVAGVTLLTGVMPALRTSIVGLRDALSVNARTMTGAPDRLRRALVVLQIGLALTIGTAGTLMLRSTSALTAAPRGYDADGVLTAALQLPSSDYPTPAALRAGLDRIMTTLDGMPATRSAMATRVPLSGGAPGSDVALVSEPFTPGTDRQMRVRFVTPAYFEVVGTPLIEGRPFMDSDSATSAPVVIVNESLARRLGTSSPVGRAVKFAVRDFDVRGPETPWTVIGIVADTRDGGPRSAVQPEIYLPMTQGPADVFDWVGRQVLVVSRPVDGRQPSPVELRAAIAQASPSLALYDVLTLTERMRDHLAPERLATAVLVPLGLAGFVLSAFGVFALLLHMVTARRRELAIRMALGATGAVVVRRLLGEGLRLTLAGAVLGCAGAFVASRAIRPLLFGVTPLDPVTIVALLMTTTLAMLLAVWIPARRAVAVDPALVLRSE